MPKKNIANSRTADYRRAGYPDVRLDLLVDGRIANPPGHAEARWRIDGEVFRFYSESGQQTAALSADGDCYCGLLLDSIYTEVSPLPVTTPRRQGPMRFVLGIPFVNRRDLLWNALRSVLPTFVGATVVIDNSESRCLGASKIRDQCEVITPTVPLTFTQTQNLLQRFATERECDVLFWMHNDSEAGPGVAADFLREVSAIWKSNPRFGVVFTNYDALCALNMTAVREVGRWDTVFTQYYSDNDYYRRLEEKGFETVTLDLNVHHHVSATINSDPTRHWINDLFMPAFERYYKLKHPDA